LWDVLKMADSVGVIIDKFLSLRLGIVYTIAMERGPISDDRFVQHGTAK
jgi:hypothetical protein